MFNRIENIIKRYLAVLKYKEDDNYMILKGFTETFKLVLISYVISVTIGFIIGLFLYNNKNTKNKIKKLLYNIIKKTINACTNMPFVIFSLFANVYLFELLFDQNDTNYQSNKGNFYCCCFALTVFLTLVCSKKIENFFIMQEKKNVTKIKNIINNRESIADLIAKKTSLFIVGFCYSTIAASSYGGVEGKSIGVIAYKYGFSKRIIDPSFDYKDFVLVCFICVILVITCIKLLGSLIEKKIRNKK